MKLLVTGAGGFIGSHVVEALLREGHHVRALAHYNGRGSWGFLDNFVSVPHPNLEVCLGDVTDAPLIRSVVDGCDVVLHLAALIGIPYSYKAPESYVATNVNGTLNILEACRASKVRRVVVTSTSEVYGTACYTPIDEKHPLQAQSPYAASKIAADKLAESYFCCFDLPVVTLRPFNTYGPRQSGRAIIPTILTQALNNVPEIELGNLSPKRDITFVEDTARAFLLASQVPGIEGQTIHFGQGSAVSISELAQKCLQTIGSNSRIVTDAGRRRPNKSEVQLLLCDPSKARSVLGWSPLVSLQEGLGRTAEYLRKHSSDYRPNTYAV